MQQEPINLSPNKFTKTGRGIEVPFSDMYNYVIEKLAEYDNLLATTQNEPSTSPYNQPVIYITNTGKTVQVPVQVQAQAVQVWLENKTGGGLIGDESEHEDEELQQQAQAQQAYKASQKTRIPPITQHRHTKVEKSKINIWIIVLLIIIVVIAYWYFFIRTR